MVAGREHPDAPRWEAAVAGFQAGMVGVLAMLAWLGAASALYRRSFWTPANLMASVFYGDSALQQHFSASTFSGLALYLIAYSLLGALFASLVAGRAGRGRAVFIGMLFGVAWYYLWWHGLWKSLDVWIAMYTHERPMLIGHLLYGGLVGRFAAYMPRPAAPSAPVVEILPAPEPEIAPAVDRPPAPPAL